MAGRYLVRNYSFLLLLQLMVLTPPGQCVPDQMLTDFAEVTGALPRTDEHPTQDYRRLQRTEVVPDEQVVKFFPYKFEGQPPEHRKSTSSSFKVLSVPADGGDPLPYTSEDNTSDHNEHLQHLEEEVKNEQDVPPFPHEFEGQPPVHHRHRQPHTGTFEATERIRFSDVVNTAQNLNLPPLPSLASVFSPQTYEPSRPWTKTETNFLFLLVSIVVKLIMSTALASWFLAAGQILYSLAALTGTTDIFGMDSAIKFIYLTLPYAEALLRGETKLTG